MSHGILLMFIYMPFFNFECNEYQYIPILMYNLWKVFVYVAFNVKAGVKTTLLIDG